MEAKTNSLKHPAHHLLSVFPFGLLAGAVVFDTIGMLFDATLWIEMAFYLIGAGLISGPVAAVFGLVDYLAIPKFSRARAIGLLHGLGNAMAMGLFGVSWLLRRSHPAKPIELAYAFSFAGTALSLTMTWIDSDTHENALSSLTDRSAIPASRTL